MVMILAIVLHRGSEEQCNNPQKDADLSKLAHTVAVQFRLVAETAVGSRGIQIPQHPGVPERVKYHQRKNHLLEPQDHRPAILKMKPDEPRAQQHHQDAGDGHGPDAHPYETDEPLVDLAHRSFRVFVLELHDRMRDSALIHQASQPDDSAKNVHAAADPEYKGQVRDFVNCYRLTVNDRAFSVRCVGSNIDYF